MNSMKRFVHRDTEGLVLVARSGSYYGSWPQILGRDFGLQDFQRYPTCSHCNVSPRSFLEYASIVVMRKPRREQLDFENGGFCHLRTRCAREMFLCGKDYDTGKDYSHRRDWIEKRLLFLTSIFSVELFGYAIMENHYHLVLNFVPRAAALWTPEEVARRWLRLFPKKTPELEEIWFEEVLRDPERVEELRKRLSTSPDFMKGLNEYIARRANHEDQITGAFWAGRYYSRQIKSANDMVGCMAYVDLNPLRANVVKDPEQPGQHTSLVRRLEEIEFLEALERELLHETPTDAVESPEEPEQSPSSEDQVSSAHETLVPLRPLASGHGQLVARSLDGGTELPVTLNCYRHRVAVLARHGAGRPQKKTLSSRKRTSSDDWLDHWLQLMEGFRLRTPARTPLYAWMKAETES